MLKNRPFHNWTQVVALILATSATPPPLNFAEFGAPALNRVIYAPHDHNTILYLPIMSEFEHRFLPLKNDHLFRNHPPPPPPNDNHRVCDHNAMPAFPQEQISHYTTDDIKHYAY